MTVKSEMLGGVSWMLGYSSCVHAVTIHEGEREEKRGRDTLKGAKREIINIVRKKGGEMTMLDKA